MYIYCLTIADNKYIEIYIYNRNEYIFIHLSIKLPTLYLYGVTGICSPAHIRQILRLKVSIASN